MARPRSSIIDLERTPNYHCMSRCVRRAFLCGDDRYTGKSFNHRKPWLVDRINLLTQMYAIDVASYAIMSNHYHLVLHVDKQRALEWSDDEVISHWLRLYKGPVLVQRYHQGHTLLDAEMSKVKEIVAIWRSRLYSISWFMSCLNEFVARKANAEDNCTGRFWEGRFKAQALFDESAMLSCMSYVDLNPIRAGIAKSLEESDYTSIQQRVLRLKKTQSKKEVAIRLIPFSETINQNQPNAMIPFNLKDYLGLVESTGRWARSDKKGFVEKSSQNILKKLNLNKEQWLMLSLEIQKESILMLHGLNKVAALEKKKTQKSQ